MRDRWRNSSVFGVTVDGWVLALVAVGLLSAVACLVATRANLGLETDSGPFVGAAHNLAHGRGMTTPFTFLSAYGPRQSLSFGDAVPLVEYPPLYPAVIGGLDAIGVPLMQAVRWVGALLLGVNVVLAGLLFLVVTKGRARPLAVAVAALMVIGPTSPNFGAAGRTNWLTLSGSVLSEPVFIALVLLTCLLLLRALETESLGLLVAAAVLAALAVLTRYVGVALVGGSMLTVLVVRRDWWRRAVLLGVIGLVPMLVWSFWIRVVDGARSGRTLAPHSAAGTWKDLVDAVEKWLLPSPWHSTLRHALMLGVAIVVVALAVVQRRSGNLAFAPVVQATLVTGCYVVAIVASRALFDVNAIDERMLAPVQPLAEVVAVGFVWSGVRTLASPRLATGLVAGAMAVLMAVSVHPIASIVSDGFPPVPTSPSAAGVGDLPDDVPVFATSAAAVWFATGRAAYELPARFDQFTLERNRDYRAQMAELTRLVERRPAAIVLIVAPNYLTFPTVADIERLMPVREVRRFRDGVVLLVGDDAPA